jgi:hypothetical protein
MLNEEDKNIQLPECHTWYFVLCTSYKTFIFTPEMETKANTHTFSTNAQQYHLLHCFHHSC